MQDHEALLHKSAFLDLVNVLTADRVSSAEAKPETSVRAETDTAL